MLPQHPFIRNEIPHAHRGDLVPFPAHRDDVSDLEMLKLWDFPFRAGAPEVVQDS